MLSWREEDEVKATGRRQSRKRMGSRVEIEKLTLDKMESLFQQNGIRGGKKIEIIVTEWLPYSWWIQKQGDLLKMAVEMMK